MREQGNKLQNTHKQGCIIVITQIVTMLGAGEERKQHIKRQKIKKLNCWKARNLQSRKKTSRKVKMPASNCVNFATKKARK